MTTVTFDYLEFPTSTRRDEDTRRHGTADVRTDALSGLFYVYGSLGCSKSRPTVREALIAYLGGRELLAHRVYD